MKKIDIVEFARKYYEDLKYIGDNVQDVQEGAEITHELLFEDKYGYIRIWSFKVDKHTGKIIPDDDGFQFDVSGFNPDEMRKKLAMVDKAKAAREN